MPDDGQNEELKIEDVGQAQRLAYAEKSQREVEAAVKAEQEGKIPNPVPAVFEALDKGQKINEEMQGKNRKLEVFRFAARAKELIDAEEVAIDDPRDVVAEKLLEEKKLKDYVLVSGLGERGGYGMGETLMVQNIVPTLRALGAIPGNAPDNLPYGEENDFLIRLLRKGGVKEGEGKVYRNGGKDAEAVVFTKDTNIPGVDVRVVVDRKFLHDYRSITNPNGFPLIERMELVFSPQALASMEPGSNDEVRK